jgi:O-antigen/teichoic acid export membrane protein
MVGLLLNVADLGRYSSAARVVRLVPFGLAAAGNVFMPVAAALFARGDRRRLEIAYRATARWGWHFGAPLTALLMVRPELVLGVFGGEFVTAASAMRILAAGQLVNLVTGSCGTTLMMTAHQLVEARNTLVSAVLGVVLCLLMIPPMGITGAAIAMAVSVAVVNVLRAVQVRRLLGLLPFSAGLARAAVASVLAGGALALLPAPAGWPLLWRLGEQGVLVLCTYGVLMLLLGLDRDDVRLLGALVERSSAGAVKPED